MNTRAQDDQERPPGFEGPEFQQLPDGQWTYTPGNKRRKLAAVILGAAIVLFGFVWQWEPIKLVLFGGTSDGKVAYVMEIKPGQEPVKLDTVKAVSDAYDPTRNAFYYYTILYEMADGERVSAELNYAQVVRPLLSIGEVVHIAYNPRDPSEIIHKWSVRTWAFGFFFVGTGLLIFVPQLMIYRAVGKPIVLDQIKDYEALSEKEIAKTEPSK